MHISLDSALGQQRRLNQVGESITQIAPDPSAAYSLRSLTGSDPKVVRVRRGSDNDERDFTASEVSSGALTSYVNAQVTAPLDNTDRRCPTCWQIMTSSSVKLISIILGFHPCMNIGQ